MICPFYVLWDEHLLSNCRSTVWKIEKFTLTEKILRQINWIVIFFDITLLSRNFSKKVWVNFCDFHTVQTWSRKPFVMKKVYERTQKKYHNFMWFHVKKVCKKSSGSKFQKFPHCGMQMFSKNVHQMNIMMMNEPLFLFKRFFSKYWISTLACVDHFFFFLKKGHFILRYWKNFRTLKQWHEKWQFELLLTLIFS